MSRKDEVLYGKNNSDTEINNEEPEPEKRDMKKEILRFLLYVLVIFCITFFILHFLGQRTKVSGSSMEATLSDGDNLIVDKLTYRFSDPERFDIIVFPYEGEGSDNSFFNKTYYIKRIIGLPGETVYIDYNGNIFINGEKLEENYGLQRINNPGEAANHITLGEDQYFVLGDNRNNSSDSRFVNVGPIEGKKITGRAWVRIYPFNKMTFLTDK
ncbi:MAG: signal peptidase I [Lachnospiraceae bacterium]|nr:signal peptidase I [Lachnospiraceae bacterium]